MKTKSLLLLASVLSVMALVGSASAQSKRLPIYSLGAGIDQNLSLVTNIEVSVSANSMLYSNGLVSYFNAQYLHGGAPKESELSALVASQTLSFRVTRPSNEWITIWQSYSSRNYEDQLFWGGQSYQMVRQTNGTNVTWKMPTSVVNVPLYLGNYVIINESNLISGTFLLRNAEGNVLQYVDVPVTFNYATGIGKMRFPSEYLGQHGEFVGTYRKVDGQGNESSFEVAFNTDLDGAQMPGTLASVTTTSDIVDLVVLTPPSIALNNIHSYEGQGTSPLVEFTVTTSQSVSISAQTSEGETATGFWLKKLVKGQKTEWVEYLIPPGYSVSVPLEPGLYHVDYTWSRFAPWQIMPYWYYGGKG